MVSLAATLGDGDYPRTGGWEKSSNDFRAAISVAAAYDLTTLDWGDVMDSAGRRRRRRPRAGFARTST